MTSLIAPKRLFPSSKVRRWEIDEREAAEELLARRHARCDLLSFVRYAWWMRGPFIEGTHTRAIADRYTKAVQDYLNGQSTFLIVEVPFRHGKSDLTSRALPAWFLGKTFGLDADVIISGYGADLVQSFSRKVQQIIRGRKFQAVFPDVRVNEKKRAANKWQIDGSNGEVIATGLGGALTGHGGHLIVVDDYCKRREEAESPTYRRRMWEAFRDDLMTRRAPTSIVIVCATPWHVDDVIGRIREEMRKDPAFPQFEVLRFPAKSDDYPSGYLFPERFSKTWYDEQFSVLGNYSAAGLLQCEPTIRSGALLDVDGVNQVDAGEFPDIKYVRFWDLASTKKERAKDDPDYTAGALIGIRNVLGGGHELWIRDIALCQQEAPERDRMILDKTETDGAGVAVYVEAQGGHKDTYANLARILHGRRTVKKVNVSSDKVMRAAALEPIFQANRVFIPRNATWREMFLEQVASFPDCKHDDIIDSVSGAVNALLEVMPMAGMFPKDDLTVSDLGHAGTPYQSFWSWYVHELTPTMMTYGVCGAELTEKHIIIRHSHAGECDAFSLAKMTETLPARGIVRGIAMPHITNAGEDSAAWRAMLNVQHIEAPAKREGSIQIAAEHCRAGKIVFFGVDDLIADLTRYPLPDRMERVESFLQLAWYLERMI